MYVRPMIRDELGTVRPAAIGDGLCMSPLVAATATDANYQLTVEDLLGGVFQRSGTNTSRTDTLPTAANLLAALASLTTGESFSCIYSNASTANPTTIATNTGITLVGLATVAAGSNRLLVFRKTSASTMSCFIC